MGQGALGGGDGPMKGCGAAHKHTHNCDPPKPGARKKRCKCGRFHVWVTPVEVKRCKECGRELPA